MSNTLQTALTFPIAMGIISAMILSGPILYQQVSLAHDFQSDAIRLSIENQEILEQVSALFGNRVVSVTAASPERMHFMISAVSDSAELMIEGVVT